jgi:polyvinyl alcohol dehydrogenase (cytochrome)
MTVVLLICCSGIATGAQARVCEQAPRQLAPLDAYAAGWGIDQRNTRYQPKAKLNSANASRLQLKWVYGLGSNGPRAYPLITDDTIYIGSDGEGLLALDRETGCERWRHFQDGQFGSAIVPASINGNPALVFNIRQRGVFAIDAVTGHLIWHAVVDDEPVPWYSGTPVVTDDAVYVPVSSMEVGLAVNPLYGCCTTSGGLAAFDLASGEKRWYIPTIAEPAAKTGSHYLWVSEYGPSGAAVWATPSYDAEQDRLYFGTGQNYSHPTTGTSNAIFAVDAASGRILWVQQYTPNDAYNASCNVVSLDHPNCPKPLGPDVDFGAATMLLHGRDGQLRLIAGQKSAEVHALDPQTGTRLWSRRLGRGGIIGGVHWGMAANEQLGLVYVPISDKAIPSFPSPGEAHPGLYALDIASGELRWQHSRAPRCEALACVYGLSAAVIAANDVVVAGSIDGYLEVLDADSGEVLWTYDAWRDYDSVNDASASGGGFDAHGPLLADDLLVVSAGYTYVGDQRPGNALLVFEVAADDE